MFELFNETGIEIKELDDIKKIVENVIKKEKLQNCVFNIIIVDDEKIHEINKTYRNKDKTTDVISFALEDFKDITYDFRLLGDIYISYDTALRQAKEFNHSLLKELSFLTVHGLLHLLGYDHMKKEDEIVMFRKQELILDGEQIS